MILSTHAIVGGAVACLLPSHPTLVAAIGFASHFAIDAIPHWDYPLRSISVGENADNRRLTMDHRLLTDLLIISLDAWVGLVVAVLLFAPHASTWVVVLGAFAGMLPDPLQFIHSLFPWGPLKILQRFHGWIHTKSRLDWLIGISSQAAFAMGVAILVPLMV